MLCAIACCWERDERHRARTQTQQHVHLCAAALLVMADYSLPHHDPRFTGANRRDQPPRGPSEKDRGRTTLFGREPNAGCGKPSKPDVLVTPCAPEMSKSHSKISCIALNQKPTDVTAFVRRLQARTNHLSFRPLTRFASVRTYRIRRTSHSASFATASPLHTSFATRCPPRPARGGQPTGQRSRWRLIGRLETLCSIDVPVGLCGQ